MRILAWISGITLGVALLLIGAIYLFSGKIKESVVAEVNKSLTAKVQVGEIEFSAWTHFPQVSIDFNQVVIEESNPLNDSALAKIEQISLTLNIWDALQEKIHIQGLNIKNGYLSMAQNAKGEDNYSIFKTSNDSGSGETSLSFQQVSLENMQVYFKNEADIYSFQFPDLSCSGDFKEEVFTAHLDGIVLAALQFDKGESFKERTFKLNSDLLIDKPNDKLKFSKTFLGLEDLAFELDGYWNIGEEQGGKIDIKTQDAQIKKLLSLLPGSVKAEIENYESSGILKLNGSIRQKGANSLVVEANFGVDNGSLFLKEFGEGLGSIRLDGDFYYSEKKQSINLNKFEARLMQDIIKGTVKLDGFDDPNLNLFVFGEFNLENLKRIADLGDYNESVGKVTLDVSLKGKVSELKDPKKYRSLYLDGKIKGEHLRLGSDSLDNKLTDVNTFLQLKSSECSIHRLEATWNEQRVQIRGEAKNYLAYLFNEEELKILGRLKAEKLHFTNPREESTKVKQSTYDTVGFQLPPRIRMEAEVEVSELSLEKFNAQNITGRVSLNSERLDIKKLKFETCSGKVELKGNWSKRASGDQPVVVNAALEKVNIQQLFEAFNNFGQTEITDKNLKGLLTGKIDAGFLLDHGFNFLPKSLYSFLDIRIDGGELNHYEPLKALSKYVRVEDLENVRFKTLENQIEIRDEVIYIPSMEIRNNAMNLHIEGQHSFANSMNYSIKIQLKDVLAGPYMKDHVEEEFEKEEEGVNVFIRMSGTPDNLSIKYDSKKARKNLKQEMKKEKQTVKEILKQEFGIKKKEQEQEEPEEDVPDWEDDIPE